MYTSNCIRTTICLSAKAFIWVTITIASTKPIYVIPSTTKIVGGTALTANNVCCTISCTCFCTIAFPSIAQDCKKVISKVIYCLHFLIRKYHDIEIGAKTRTKNKNNTKGVKWIIHNGT